MAVGDTVRLGCPGALAEKTSLCKREATWRASAGARTGSTALSSAHTGLWSELTTSMQAAYVFASTDTSAPETARSRALPGSPTSLAAASAVYKAAISCHMEIGMSQP
jgi:hypothetical protein